eukprot:4770258-Karenia_brevis.AAC.1
MDSRLSQQNGGDERQKARMMLQGLPKRFRVHGLRSDWRCIDALNLDGRRSTTENTKSIFTHHL